MIPIKGPETKTIPEACMLMNARQLAAQLTAWIEATSIQIAQKRYLARLEARPDDQKRLLAEAMTLELLCEEFQACVRRYSTVRQLRGAVQQTLQAIQRTLARSSDAFQSQHEPDEISAWMEGRIQAYRTALREIAEMIS
jgi:uncharacterized membrane protein